MNPLNKESLSREVCRACRMSSKEAGRCGYQVERELTYTWACPAMIEKHPKDSDAHVVDVRWPPPDGCPRKLEHAVAAVMSKC
jgi:hypothetical protein